MNFTDILESARKTAANADSSGVDFMAVQINIEGDPQGVFYVEVKDGRINVEPYEYNDRQCSITISGQDFESLLEGKLDPVKAFTQGRIKVNGDLGKALKFSKLFRKKVR